MAWTYSMDVHTPDTNPPPIITGMACVSSRNVVARGGGANAMAPPPTRGGVFAGLRSPAPHRDAGPTGPFNGMGGPFGGGSYASSGPSFGGPSFQAPQGAGRSFSGRAAGARIDNSIVGRRIKIARGQFRVRGGTFVRQRGNGFYSL